MIMFRDKFIALLLSVAGRFADDLDSAGCVQYGHAGFGKFETIDPIEAAFFRLAARFHHAALSRSRLA